MFKNLYKIIPVLLALTGLVATSQGFSESAVMDQRFSSYHRNNYNGPIKSSQWYYNFIIDSIPFATSSQINARSSIMHQNKDVLGWNVFREFDEKGKLTTTVAIDVDRSYFGKSELNYKTASIYLYNEEDWIKKNEMRMKKRQIYPVNDHNILVKPNINKPFDNGYGADTLKQSYEYILDEKGRIISEIYYRRDVLPYTETEYIYDDRDNVKQLNIRTKQKKPIPFHFLDTETGFCPDLHIAYQYDGKDRMTQVTYFGCNDTLAFEKYVYHPEQEFVTERTRFIKSSMRSVTHVTQTMVFYHNENGDIIEKKYVRNRPNQYLGASSIALPESIYYTYEYDQYNNWVKCYIYMEGTPEDSEPTAIAQRDLEYYDS